MQARPDSLALLELNRSRTVTEAGADMPVQYQSDIKPLFRSRDQQAMKFALDLMLCPMSDNVRNRLGWSVVRPRECGRS
jgi:hypothetical protein